MAKSSSLNTKVNVSVSSLVLFALVFGMAGGFALRALYAAPVPNYRVGISSQSTGNTTLSINTSVKNPPSGLVMTSTCYDGNAVLVNKQEVTLTSWVSNPPDMLAFASFTNQPSGIGCFGLLHKAGSTNELGAVSYWVK